MFGWNFDHSIGADFTHVLYEFSIHTWHNQHVDLFRIEKRISIVTHIIGLRKNTLTKTFGTQSPYLTPRKGGHERKPPIRPFIRVLFFDVFVHVTRVELMRRTHQRRSNTAKSQCGLSWWRTSQNNSKNIIFTGKFWSKKLKSDRFWPFFWPPWSPPVPLRGGSPLGTACGCDFRGVTFRVDLTSWLDKLSLVKWFEEGPEARVTSQLDKRNLSSFWLVNFGFCSKRKCRTLGQCFFWFLVVNPHS